MFQNLFIWCLHLDISEYIVFSLGKDDQVLCFYCEGGLQNWKSNDDPWEEHAKHFPRCGFLNETKSPEYVRNVHDNVQRTSNDRILQI